MLGIGARWVRSKGKRPMTRLSILAGAGVLLLATPALAFHCPTDAAAIDQALSALELSDEVEAEARALRDQGMELHEAGNHADSGNTLAEAMRLILTNVE